MNNTCIPLSQNRLAQICLQGLLAWATLCPISTAWCTDATPSNPLHTTHAAPQPTASTASAPASAASAADKSDTPIVSLRSTVAKQLREAIEQSNEASGIKKKSTADVAGAQKNASQGTRSATSAVAAKGRATPAEVRSRRVDPAISTKASGTHGPVAAHDSRDAPHWSYEGETGPQAWGQLQPSFNLCAIGKRQSPIHIDDSEALLGPAEPLQIDYRPSGGSVVNNGHTIQVDLQGDNTLTVRGSTYKLVQFHFHHPAEEKLNYKGFAMVAHLVHQNAQGQLAVLAVLFDPGEASPMIQKVWTHMPLDAGDRVSLPDGLIDLNETLPKDMRYYQFIGSLTTPPCTEGVLWLVLRQPMTLSREQLKLFAQLFPNNARPTQPGFGRVVREAQ
jgi:carbonic anhydrase